MKMNKIKYKENEMEIGVNNGLVGFIMMPEEKEDNSFVLFINSEFKNKTLHDMDSPFTSEIMGKRLVVIRVDDNFSDFVFNNLSQEGILFAGFINSSFASLFNSRSISHFSSNISETELNLMNLPSFNTLFISSTCSGLGGNSSTGCQSIFSQNSQSSSVISRVCLYLLDMSCFRSLITALAKNLESRFSSDLISSCILTNNIGKTDYLSFSIGEIKKQILVTNKILCSKEESLSKRRGEDLVDMSKQPQTLIIIGLML